MTGNRFAPHGEVHHDIVGRCLVTHVDGTWNVEMHARSNAEAAPYIAQLMQTGPWAAVIVVTRTLVTGLEVLEHGRELVVASREAMRIAALAWVIPPGVEGYKLLLGRYASLYEGVLPTAVFTNLDEALQWSESRVEEAA